MRCMPAESMVLKTAATVSQCASAPPRWSATPGSLRALEAPPIASMPDADLCSACSAYSARWAAPAGLSIAVSLKRSRSDSKTLNSRSAPRRRAGLGQWAGVATCHEVRRRRLSEQGHMCMCDCGAHKLLLLDHTRARAPKLQEVLLPDHTRESSAVSRS